MVWAEGTLKIIPNGMFCGLDAATWAGTKSVALRLSTSEPSDRQTGAAKPTNLPHILVATLRAIDAIALRTTVPATSSSRSGAGSGTKDDD